ncbi:hypothetical protein ACFU7D_17730 [Nocardioides sp. NPDC057577]|uniref:hypothetical protein n=1 Tax=Nocardioides sp. NPDC057577 TaxID=3346171 RepID=UPI00366ACCE3
MTPDEVDAYVATLDGCRHKPRGWYVNDRLVARHVDATTLLVRVPIEAREALIERWPDAFGIPPRMEAHHKIEAYLDRAAPEAVREAIRLAWDFQRYSGFRHTDT